MSNSMPVEVISKVLNKFDKGTELKINKYQLSYNKGGGYKWSFIGTINGQDARLSLTKGRDGQYSLTKVETRIVEEFLQKNLKIETTEEL